MLCDDVVAAKPAVAAKVNPWEKDKVDLLELQVRDKIKRSNTKRAMAAIMRKNKKAKN